LIFLFKYIIGGRVGGVICIFIDDI